jgi:hypothetical protein
MDQPHASGLQHAHDIKCDEPSRPESMEPPTVSTAVHDRGTPSGKQPGPTRASKDQTEPTSCGAASLQQKEGRRRRKVGIAAPPPHSSRVMMENALQRLPARPSAAVKSMQGSLQMRRQVTVAQQEERAASPTAGRRPVLTTGGQQATPSSQPIEPSSWSLDNSMAVIAAAGQQGGLPLWCGWDSRVWATASSALPSMLKQQPDTCRSRTASPDLGRHRNAIPRGVQSSIQDSGPFGGALLAIATGSAGVGQPPPSPLMSPPMSRTKIPNDKRSSAHTPAIIQHLQHAVRPHTHDPTSNKPPRLWQFECPLGMTSNLWPVVSRNASCTTTSATTRRGMHGNQGFPVRSLLRSRQGSPGTPLPGPSTAHERSSASPTHSPRRDYRQSSPAPRAGMDVVPIQLVYGGGEEEKLL